MDRYITIFNPESEEYKILQAFAKRLSESSSTIDFRVEDTYFDVGQDWKWTTIIAHRRDMDPGSVLASWQALSSKDQTNIILNNEDAMEKLFDKLVK